MQRAAVRPGDAPARDVARRHLVREPLLEHRHRRLGVVGRAEVAQHAVAALAAAKQEAPGGLWYDAAVALASQIGHDRAEAEKAFQKLVAGHADDGAYQIAQVHALRRDPDKMFQWLERALANRDPGIGYLLSDPFILRYRNDPRFAAFCGKVGLPTITDATQMK